MPRPKLQSAGQQLSPGQAAYVLERLVQDRRISQGEINRYAAELTREISTLETRLQQLRSQGGGAASGAAPKAIRRGRRSAANAAAGGARRERSAARRPSRKSAAITAEQLESRKLQGRYLSLVRQIPAGKRAHYRKVVKERGRAAAIKEMQAAIGK